MQLWRDLEDGAAPNIPDAPASHIRSAVQVPSGIKNQACVGSVAVFAIRTKTVNHDVGPFAISRGCQLEGRATAKAIAACTSGRCRAVQISCTVKDQGGRGVLGIHVNRCSTFSFHVSLAEGKSSKTVPQPLPPQPEPPPR
jgi:hypothetical protein